MQVPLPNWPMDSESWPMSGNWAGDQNFIGADAFTS